MSALPAFVGISRVWPSMRRFDERPKTLPQRLSAAMRGMGRRTPITGVRVSQWDVSRAASFLLLVMGAVAPVPESASAADPWEQRYVDQEATGPAVLGLWQFLPGAEKQAAAGNGYNLTLRGSARFDPRGKFGSCLESFGAGGQQQAHGVRVANSIGLTPRGAFTIEMWIKPKSELDSVEEATLLDKMYVCYKHRDPAMECQRDYALKINRAGRGSLPEYRVLVAVLGFGDGIVKFTSLPARYEPGTWYHIAFSYDGNGRGRFFRNGQLYGEGRHPGRQGVTPGGRELVIGDRYGSSFNGFPGFIDQVRITGDWRHFYSETVSLRVTGRTAFRRMERNAEIECSVRSNRKSVISSAFLSISGEGLPATRVNLPPLAADAAHPVRYAINTRRRPGEYRVRAQVEDADGHSLSSAEVFSVTLVPRPLPRRMPVVMWGAVNLFDTKERERIERIGFTHSIGIEVDGQRIYRTGKVTETGDTGLIDLNRRALDFAFAHGHSIAAGVSPGWNLRSFAPEFRRIDRSGKPTVSEWFARLKTRRGICGLCPGAGEFCYNLGASVARDYGDYPAFDAALINSEIRDGSHLCFHAWDRESFRAHSGGRDIPAGVLDKNGISYKSIKDFPVSRVVSHDHPILVYYRWFWKEGDGWNALHAAAQRGLKSTGRSDFWTWFDPAVRCPSIWGNGAGLDVLSHWTYSYPNPLRVGWATDKVFAMAAGAPEPQRVMKITQAIWYRSETAPKPPPGGKEQTPNTEWRQRLPDADFITIAPDHLREAFWSKIARPVQGIMYHGWGSLVDTGASRGYCFTHPRTQDVLAELTRRVVKPLGPMLLQVPDRSADVGLLESFTSQMFTAKRSTGRNTEDMHLTLQYAQLQPQILYEESVVQFGLDGFRVLVMPDCDVLTQRVVDRILEFQRRGGVVVADEFLPPAITPDIRLPSHPHTGKPDQDKAALLARAADLRRQLDPVYCHFTDSSNPDVVTRARQFGSTDYLFAVNDRREYGDYVGGYGLVMERGLPCATTLSLARTSGFVYDMLNGRTVTARSENGMLKIDHDFGSGDGALFMVTSRAIAKVDVDAPREALLGGTMRFTVSVTDDRGEPLDAVLPVRIEILDPDGRMAEFSGYYGAVGGQITVQCDLAPNDEPGSWRIRARELASGISAEHAFTIRP